MPFPLEDVLAVHRAKPETGIYLGQRQLVGHLDFLKGLVAFVFMKANPPTVRGQAHPKNRERQKCPSRCLNCSRGFQDETMKGEFCCPEQSPCL